MKVEKTNTTFRTPSSIKARFLIADQTSSLALRLHTVPSRRILLARAAVLQSRRRSALRQIRSGVGRGGPMLPDVGTPAQAAALCIVGPLLGGSDWTADQAPR